MVGCPQPCKTRKGKTAGGPSTVFKHPAAPSEQGVHSNTSLGTFNDHHFAPHRPAVAPVARALATADTRQLTLTYSSYQHRRDGFWTGSRRFPVLRLSGVWLERAGFAPGQRVQVRVDAGRLVIEPAG